MTEADLNAVLSEWEELDKEYHQLEFNRFLPSSSNNQEQHRSYSKLIAEVKQMQQKCMAGIAHQRYRFKNILDTCKRLKPGLSELGKSQTEELQEKIKHRKVLFRDIEETLPHKNGLYLTIILGSVNVSLLSKQDKYKYKEDYERFKLVITVITILFAMILFFFVDYRVTDAAFQFLLVWYYCTLTIREHILKVNGSRIRGWWITHHFVSTLSAGILLIWPAGVTYKLFRQQFVVFSMYLSVVQLVQYYYQKGCLYRLRALGERHNMDITVEGFQEWMWKGLTFVLPFLFGGYLFQFYNAYVLYHLSYHEACTEWQVSALGLLFFVLFMCNTWTTSGVVRQKLKKEGYLEFIYKNKYRFNNSKVHRC